MTREQMIDEAVRQCIAPEDRVCFADGLADDIDSDNYRFPHSIAQIRAAFQRIAALSLEVEE